jgi:hypothetical protein
MLDRLMDGDDDWGDERQGAADRLLADPSPIDPVEGDSGDQSAA